MIKLLNIFSFFLLLACFYLLLESHNKLDSKLAKIQLETFLLNERTVLCNREMSIANSRLDIQRALIDKISLATDKNLLLIPLLSQSAPTYKVHAALAAFYQQRGLTLLADYHKDILLKMGHSRIVMTEKLASYLHSLDISSDLR